MLKHAPSRPVRPPARTGPNSENHERGITMSRMKSIFALLLLTVIVGIVPQARAATTVEVTIVGASAPWQTIGLAAYQEAGAGAGHWTSASNVISVTDTRVTPVNVDLGTLGSFGIPPLPRCGPTSKLTRLLETAATLPNPSAAKAGGWLISRAAVRSRFLPPFGVPTRLCPPMCNPCLPLDFQRTWQRRSFVPKMRRSLPAE